MMADLVALAHERHCETELADQLAADFDAGGLPDLKRMVSCRFSMVALW
ncbi:hypothetical protein ABIB68_006665 [Bradyrhizobium sp. F1.2.2]